MEFQVPARGLEGNTCKLCDVIPQGDASRKQNSIITGNLFVQISNQRDFHFSQAAIVPRGGDPSQVGEVAVNRDADNLQTREHSAVQRQDLTAYISRPKYLIKERASDGNKHLCIQRLKIRCSIRERNDFSWAHKGEIQGIKEQHQPFACENSRERQIKNARQNAGKLKYKRVTFVVSQAHLLSNKSKIK